MDKSNIQTIRQFDCVKILINLRFYKNLGLPLREFIVLWLWWFCYTKTRRSITSTGVSQIVTLSDREVRKIIKSLKDKKLITSKLKMEQSIFNRFTDETTWQHIQINIEKLWSLKKSIPRLETRIIYIALTQFNTHSILIDSNIIKNDEALRWYYKDFQKKWLLNSKLEPIIKRQKLLDTDKQSLIDARNNKIKLLTSFNGEDIPFWRLAKIKDITKNTKVTPKDIKIFIENENSKGTLKYIISFKNFINNN